MLELGLFSVTLALALVAAILFAWSGRRNRHLLSRIPSPPGLPVIGILLELMCTSEELLSKLRIWGEELGPVVNLRAPGMSDILVTGPDEIQIILNSQENLSKGKTYYFIQPWLHRGLLTSTGDKWRSRRRMLTPAFHYKILEGFLPVFNTNSAILVEKLRNHVQDDYVEIDDCVTLCTLDIICETVMGTSVNIQKGGGVAYIRAVKRMCELFMYRAFSPWLYSDFMWKLSSTGREEMKVVKILKDFSGNIIKKKRLEYIKPQLSPEDIDSESKKRLSFLDMLLEMSEQEGKLTDGDIREEVDTFMFAGHDTSSVAVCWTLFLLGSHQEIQEKVASEMSGIFGSDDREPTAADLNNMTYLDMVMKEALRLYPSVAAIARCLETELKLGDYIVPKGMNLLVSSFIVHRNPDIYPDPDKFDPERFSPEQSFGRHPYAYLPFSAGPRNCIGQKFARLENKCIISAILRNFKLKSLDVNDVILMPDVVLKPKQPLKIKVSLRL